MLEKSKTMLVYSNGTSLSMEKVPAKTSGLHLKATFNLMGTSATFRSAAIAAGDKDELLKIRKRLTSIFRDNSNDPAGCAEKVKRYADTVGAAAKITVPGGEHVSLKDASFRPNKL